MLLTPRLPITGNDLPEKAADLDGAEQIGSHEASVADARQFRRLSPQVTAPLTCDDSRTAARRFMSAGGEKGMDVRHRRGIHKPTTTGTLPTPHL
jgi:hypothetical protein